jgi:hypothetical protein
MVRNSCLNYAYQYIDNVRRRLESKVKLLGYNMFVSLCCLFREVKAVN